MNKMLFLAMAIAIAAVVGVAGLTVTQKAQAHVMVLETVMAFKVVAVVAAETTTAVTTTHMWQLRRYIILSGVLLDTMSDPITCAT